MNAIAVSRREIRANEPKAYRTVLAVEETRRIAREVNEQRQKSRQAELLPRQMAYIAKKINNAAHKGNCSTTYRVHYAYEETVNILRDEGYNVGEFVGHRGPYIEITW